MTHHEGFTYSLRYALQPNRDNTKRIDDLLAFCRKGKIDEVNFFINHEEINRGHLSLEDSQIWIELILELKQILAKEEIRLSLNPGITLMHGDLGRVINPKMNIGTMTDADGTEATAVACPLSDNWQEYIADIYGLYATTEPDILWLEDDLRHFNHRPIKWGCFCQQHMGEFSRRIGKEVTREEFIKGILKPGRPHPYRQVYLDVCQETMLNVSKKINNKVSKISPETKLALMTSQPGEHAAEGRDWLGLFDNLSGKHPYVARPHLPAYNEVSLRNYSNRFNTISRVTADILGKGAELFPELENYMYSPYTKSNFYTRLQLESSLVLKPKGTTMNLFDMMGTGVVLDYNLQRTLGEVKPFLEEVSSLNLELDQQQGVKVLYSTQGSYTVQTSEGRKRQELIPREDSWLALLGAFGISDTPTQFVHGELRQEVVAISGQYLRNLENDEIIEIFTYNFVLLDGMSAAILDEKDLGYLIGMTSCQWYPSYAGYQTYEQVSNGDIYCGIEEARMSLMQETGSFLAITYKDDENEVISTAYNEWQEEIGPMSVKGKNYFVLPIDWHEDFGWSSQFISFKEEMVQKILAEQRITHPIRRVSKMPFVNLYHYKQKNQEVYVLVNFSLDSYETVKLNLGIENQVVQVVSRSGYERAQYNAEDELLNIKLAACDVKVVIV